MLHSTQLDHTAKKHPTLYLNQTTSCKSRVYEIWTSFASAAFSADGAAPLIVGKRKYDYITDTMRYDLHWLPVRQRIQYKLCMLVSKCLRRTAPSYLTDKCIPVSSTAGRQHLRSAAHHDLTILRSRLARCGSRSFAASGPSLWNSLPLTIRGSTLTFAGFCSRLKTELYITERMVDT